VDGVWIERIQDVGLSNAPAGFRIFLPAVPSMDAIAENSMTQIRFKRKEQRFLDVLEGSSGEAQTSGEAGGQGGRANSRSPWQW
jgi:hypothetical protein